MCRIAAIDDEDIFLEKCKGITKSYFDERKIQYEIKTYKHASLVLEDIKDSIYFDIFLIDIEMDDMNGMELARRIRQLYDSPYIIFVTSYMEYSIKGYEYNAWRYIVKDEMHQNLPLAYDSLIARVKEKKQKFYIIEHPKKILKLLYEDIYYIYKDGKNAVFVTRNCFWNDRVSLEEVLQILDDSMFVRCERGNIANIRHVMSIEDNELIMRNGEKIHISNALVKTVKKAITEYWRNQR